MLTFVTAFLDLHEDRSQDKSVDTCFQHFQKLAKTGIPLILFTSIVYIDKFRDFPNVTVIPIELHDLLIYKQTECVFGLPSNRTPHHDTRAFMILMNAKIEFIKRAMDFCNSSHLAWIDFSICHVFRDEKTLGYLQMLSKTQLTVSCSAFPGCWQKGDGYSQISSNVNWRFCGGFFLGDRTFLSNLFDLYMYAYPKILRDHATCLWEVNVWHILEQEYGFVPGWFKADHNDSIVRVPNSLISVVASLTTIPPRIGACRATIDSLIGKVDHVYLSVADNYMRFGGGVEIPAYFQEEPYKGFVTIVRGEDKGPAMKYLGALSQIPENQWIFFCDDDQEYSSQLIEKMKERVDEFCVYQNRFKVIQQTTSGGLIHGYVGNLIHRSLLNDLSVFPLPPCSFHVDDQWMSIYCFLKGIPIRATGIEAYEAIFQKLYNNHELLGVESLSSLGTRDTRVKELATFFGVQFIENGGIKKIEFP